MPTAYCSDKNARARTPELDEQAMDGDQASTVVDEYPVQKSGQFAPLMCLVIFSAVARFSSRSKVRSVHTYDFVSS